MKEDIRIVVCGDPGVGKSSIIKVLITETFEEEVQPVLPTVVVPRDVTPEKVHVSIVDTPSDPPFEGRLNEELNRADVIILVYDVSVDETRERVKTFWMPKFRSMGLKVPVVLVANKIDKRPGNNEQPSPSSNMGTHVRPIMNEFRELDVCVECSAKNIMNIAEVFYYAQKAVLHPTAPLYDVEKDALKPDTALALRRIFKLCDRDKDGSLNDKELNDFQYDCFRIHLRDDELKGVKAVVSEKGPPNGIASNGGLTVEGFLFLHMLFIQRGRLETTWIVLRKFGYEDNLRLSLANELKVSMKSDQSCELSSKGVTFLESLFDQADKDNDGVLTHEEYKEILSAVPDNPFESYGDGVSIAGEDAKAGEKGRVTKKAFLCRFVLLALQKPETAILSLVYLGYTEDPISTIQITKSRKRDRYARTVSRRVFNILVMGKSGTGKSELIYSFGESEFGSATQGQGATSCGAVPVAKEFGGGEKHLVLRELAEANVGRFLSSKAEYDACDLLCMVFDVTNSESLDFCKNLLIALKGKSNFKLPVIFAATKMDLIEGDSGSSEGEKLLAEADKFCASNGLPAPVRISAKEHELENIFPDLVGVVLHPQLACPEYYADSASESSYTGTIIKIAAGSVAAGLAIYGAKVLYDYYKRPTAATS